MHHSCGVNMDHLQKVTIVAAAAAVNTDFTKPAGGPIIIRRISLATVQNIEFGYHRGWLEKIAPGIMYIALYNKIVPNTTYPVVLFDGEQEWPENFRLRLREVTQNAADALRFVVSYEIRKPEKKRWY